MRQIIKESLDRYARDRTPTGGFLRAVLENNLTQAIGRADDGNLKDIQEICSYIYNEIPLTSHGSPEKVKAWLGGRT